MPVLVKRSLATAALLSSTPDPAPLLSVSAVAPEQKRAAGGGGVFQPHPADRVGPGEHHGHLLIIVDSSLRRGG